MPIRASCCRRNVCLSLCIDKTCVCDVFSKSPLNKDTLAYPLGVCINRVLLYRKKIWNSFKTKLLPKLGETVKGSMRTGLYNCTLVCGILRQLIFLLLCHIVVMITDHVLSSNGTWCLGRNPSKPIVAFPYLKSDFVFVIVWCMNELSRWYKFSQQFWPKQNHREGHNSFDLCHEEFRSRGNWST